MIMKKRKHITAIFVAACILIVAIVGVIVYGLTRPGQPDLVEGQAETTDYRMSCKVPARIRRLLVREGDRVRRGDTLALLEAPDLRAKLEQARAARSAAEAVDRKAERGTRYEQVEAAYELWQKAQAGMVIAGKTYDRVNRLYEQGVMTEQKRDEARAQYDAMKATLKAAKAQLDMARNGARREDKDAARAQVMRAQGAVSEVSSYLGETVLLAPVDGYVTEIYPEVGELVGSGAPVMNVSSADDVWFTFNLREDRLAGLRLGAVREVYVPALGKRLRVRISRMKDVGSFAVWKATRSLDGYDLKTFEVRARPIDLKDTGRVRSGMSAIMK